MQNLRDKLLKAGLVSADQAKKAEVDRSRPLERKREPLAAVSLGPIPKLPPLPGSKAHQRQEAANQRARDAELRALVVDHQVPVEIGPRTFHFVTRKGKLRRMDLSEAQALLLEEGSLAVVERQEPAQIEHTLVPRETAERMLTLFPKSVRFLSRPGDPVGFVPESDEQSEPEEPQEDPVRQGG